MFKAYVPPVIFCSIGADNAISFLHGIILNIFFTNKIMIFFKITFAYSLGKKMYLILMKNSYGIKVELFALCVHFICVGLNCQHERKETPGGIYR